jgi:hypothetical protein
MDHSLLASNHRIRQATQMYYMVYDKPPDERRIIAIHRVYESAAVCFNKLMKSGDYTRVLQLWRVCTNEFGFAVSEEPLYTYSKQLNLVINHSQAGSDGRPPPIQVPRG